MLANAWPGTTAKGTFVQQQDVAVLMLHVVAAVAVVDAELPLNCLYQLPVLRSKFSLSFHELPVIIDLTVSQIVGWPLPKWFSQDATEWSSLEATEMIQFSGYWNDPVFKWNDPVFWNDPKWCISQIEWQISDLPEAKGRTVLSFVEPHAEEAVGFIIVC